MIAIVLGILLSRDPLVWANTGGCGAAICGTLTADPPTYPSLCTMFEYHVNYGGDGEVQTGNQSTGCSGYTTIGQDIFLYRQHDGLEIDSNGTGGPISCGVGCTGGGIGFHHTTSNCPGDAGTYYYCTYNLQYYTGTSGQPTCNLVGLTNKEVMSSPSLAP
jgi:hypothetical protein